MIQILTQTRDYSSYDARCKARRRALDTRTARRAHKAVSSRIDAMLARLAVDLPDESDVLADCQSAD